MVTVSRTSAPWVTVIGTTTEIAAHLKAQNVPIHKIGAIYYNGTNETLIYHNGV